LDELASADREVCKALAELGVVSDTAKLIANKFKAHGPSTYFGILLELACTYLVLFEYAWIVRIIEVT